MVSHCLSITVEAYRQDDIKLLLILSLVYSTSLGFHHIYILAMWKYLLFSWIVHCFSHYCAFKPSVVFGMNDLLFSTYLSFLFLNSDCRSFLLVNLTWLSHLIKHFSPMLYSPLGLPLSKSCFLSLHPTSCVSFLYNTEIFSDLGAKFFVTLYSQAVLVINYNVSM